MKTDVVANDFKKLYERFKKKTDSTLAAIQVENETEKDERVNDCSRLQEEIKDLLLSRLNYYVTQVEVQDMYDIEKLIENENFRQHILGLEIRKEKENTIVEFLEGGKKYQVKFVLNSHRKCLDFNAIDLLTKREEEELKSYLENLPQLLYKIRKIVKDKHSLETKMNK